MEIEIIIAIALIILATSLGLLIYILCKMVQLFKWEMEYTSKSNKRSFEKMNNDKSDSR